MTPRKAPPTPTGPDPSPENPLATLDLALGATHILGSRLRLSILLVLKHRGPSTIEEIAEALEIARPTVHRALAELRSDGVVVAGAEPPNFRPLIFRLDKKRLATIVTTIRTTLVK